MSKPEPAEFYFRGLRQFCDVETWTSRNNHAPRPRGAWLLDKSQESFLAKCESESLSCVSVFSHYVQTQYAVKTRGLSKHVCSNWLPREKDTSVKSRHVKSTEKEFLFGSRKPLFLGMRQFHFLSETSRGFVIFVFIYLISYSFYFLMLLFVLFFNFLFNPHTISSVQQKAV